MKNYFYLDESPTYHNKFNIRVDVDTLPFKPHFKGAFSVLPSRLLGLSFAEYLRYTRDRLGAELVGRNSTYITPYFDRTPEVKEFIKLLNNRMELIMLERNKANESK